MLGAVSVPLTVQDIVASLSSMNMKYCISSYDIEYTFSPLISTDTASTK